MSKILFVIQTLNKGGAERVVSNLSKEFVNLGHEVKIILFNNQISYDYGGAIISLQLPASKNYLIKFFRLFQRIARLKKIFNQENPDFIFSFMESCNFASILTGKNVVISVRNNPNKFTLIQRFLIQILYKFKNVLAVVCVSKEIENILKNNYKIGNLVTIQNPIVFDNSYKIKEDLSNFKPFILAVGRLHTQKNFQMLINAYAKTKAKNETKLLILGDGNLKNELNLLIQKLNLQQKVFLLGLKDNIKDYYLQCEIFILSSLYEGFPNALIEALSNNSACIVTDCPTGPSEIITNLQNGILIENNNEKAMSEAIDKLYFDKEMLDKIRHNAKNSIQYLDVKNIAKKWLEL